LGSNIPSPRNAFGSILQDEIIYLFGGSTEYLNARPPYFDDILSYDIAADSWQTLTSVLPVPMRELAIAVSGTTVHIFGGFIDGGYSTTHYADYCKYGCPKPKLCTGPGICLIANGVCTYDIGCVEDFNPLPTILPTIPFQIPAPTGLPMVSVPTVPPGEFIDLTAEMTGSVLTDDLTADPVITGLPVLPVPVMTGYVLTGPPPEITGLGEIPVITGGHGIRTVNSVFQVTGNPPYLTENPVATTVPDEN